MSSIKYRYKSTLSVKYWHWFLERKLTQKEHFYLYDAKIEKQDNVMLRKIYSKAMEENLYISELTSMDGNCLFESLVHTGFHEDPDTLRQTTALLMTTFADVDLEKEFGDTEIIHSSPREIFGLMNEVDFVYCRKQEKLYKYTYDTMCRDIYGERNWNRVPTELILRVLAITTRTRIRIFHCNGHITDINPKNAKTTINLGLMGECHYVPLVSTKHAVDNDDIKCPQFNDARRQFHRWAQKMCLEMGEFDIF